MTYDSAAIKACQKLFENQELCRLINDLMLDSSGITLSSLPIQEVPKAAVVWLQKVASSEMAWDTKRDRSPTSCTQHTLDVINEIQTIMASPPHMP